MGAVCCLVLFEVVFALLPTPVLLAYYLNLVTKKWLALNQDGEELLRTNARSGSPRKTLAPRRLLNRTGVVLRLTSVSPAARLCTPLKSLLWKARYSTLGPV